MASIFEQYGIKEVADVTFYERDTAGNEKPVLYIDTAKVSTIEKTASTAEARGGKGNPALISWDFGLEINVTLEDALFSSKSMAIMQGSGKVIEGTTTKPVYVDVTGEVYEFPENSTTTERHSIELKHVYQKNSIYIYEIDDNGRWINGEQLRGWEPVDSEGKSTTTETKYISWSTGGTEISTNKVAIFYKTPIQSDMAQKIEINSDTFPGTYRVVGDTYARNRSTGKDEYFQFIIHRAKMNPENTITLSADGDPSTFNMSLKVLRNIGNSGMIDLIKYNFDDASEEVTDLGPSDTKPNGN